MHFLNFQYKRIYAKIVYLLIFLFLGYQKFVDPGVSPEFQVTAIRFGMTMAPPGVYMRYYTFLPRSSN